MKGRKEGKEARGAERKSVQLSVGSVAAPEGAGAPQQAKLSAFFKKKAGE